jgi:6-methylsalicylate decarboxylase
MWEDSSVLQCLDRAGIQMQMLSYVPHDHNKLRAGNNYGLYVVEKYQTRLGLLAVLSTDDAQASLDEINWTTAFVSAADGFAVGTLYKWVCLSDPLYAQRKGLHSS